MFSKMKIWCWRNKIALLMALSYSSLGVANMVHSELNYGSESGFTFLFPQMLALPGFLAGIMVNGNVHAPSGLGFYPIYFLTLFMFALMVSLFVSFLYRVFIRDPE